MTNAAEYTKSIRRAAAEGRALFEANATAEEIAQRDFLESDEGSRAFAEESKAALAARWAAEEAEAAARKAAKNARKKAKKAAKLAAIAEAQ